MTKPKSQTLSQATKIDWQPHKTMIASSKRPMSWLRLAEKYKY